jgi:predicted nucleic acid-binding Zn ribbon protein
MSDAPLTQCPQCEKDSFRKQVTAAGFQLKGSGWYVTDFRGGSNGSSASTNNAAAASAESKSEAKAETKSDSASAPAASSTPAATDA